MVHGIYVARTVAVKVDEAPYPPPTSPLHLPYIVLYLPYISPTSPLHLPTSPCTSKVDEVLRVGVYARGPLFPIRTTPRQLPAVDIDPQLLRHIHRNAVSNAPA